MQTHFKALNVSLACSKSTPSISFILFIWSLFLLKYLELLETIFISGLKFIYNDFNKSSKPLNTERTIIKDEVPTKTPINAAILRKLKKEGYKNLIYHNFYFLFLELSQSFLLFFQLKFLVNLFPQKISYYLDNHKFDPAEK